MRLRETTESYGTIGGGTCSRKGVATSTNVVLAPGTVYFNHVGVSNPTIDLGHKTETISDEMGPPGKFKGVVHEIVDYQLYVNTVNAMHEYDKTGRVEIYTGEESLWHTFPPISEFSGNRIAVVYDKSVQELLNLASHDFYKENQADNLLNLVEFRQLRNGLEGSISFFRRLNRFAQMNKTIPLKKWAGQRLVDLNSQFLAYSFGYAPLLSDLKKTYKGLKTMSSTLTKLKSGSRRITKTAECSGVVNPTYTGLSGYSATVPSTPNDTWFTVDINPGEPKRLVGVRGIDTKSYETSGFRNLDHMLTKYFGTGPATLAWELVPFSFVLDWFVDLHPVLDAIDNTLTGSTKRLQYCWVSEKFDVRSGYFKHRSTSTNRSSLTHTLHDWPQDGSLIGYTHYRHYHRNLTQLTPLVTASGRFGKKQQTLFGALALQSVANLKRRMH